MNAMAGTSRRLAPPTEAIGPVQTPLGEVVREHARARPDAVAVRDDSGALTYAELLSRALAVAAAFDDAGAPLEIPVAVCGTRDRHLVLGALAARLAGRPYLLVDIAQPFERARFMLRASGVQVALATSPDGSGYLAEIGGPAKILDLAALRVAEVEPPIRSEDVAYLCFTSGSTGRPKGVRVPAAGIDALAEWYVTTHAVTADDRLSQVSSPSFDAWGFEVWPALRGGAELVVAPVETVRSPSALAAWLVHAGISICFLVTPLAVEVLEDWPAGADNPRLRAMLLGGDRLVRPPVERPPFRLFNNYGPTECSVVATATEVVTFGECEAPPIGSPLPYVEIEVRRPDGTPCEINEPGELLLGGPALSPGYIDEADTQAAFVRESTSGGGERRLYRTGDVVRADGNGVLYFVGRLDDQVKVNGVRIEPGEVEAALTSHPGVIDAAVVTQETPSGDVRLVGFIVGDADPRAVRATAARRLPQVMVPYVVVVDRLPVTVNGKVDRIALRALKADRPDRLCDARPATDESDVPRTSALILDGGIVPVVMDAWVDILGVKDVRAGDDFFDLGGDSLRAMRLIRRLGKAGIRMTPEDLYRSSTFGDLIEVLAEPAGGNG